MCTLSFIPRKNGYSLAMNRDEQRTRPKALPPNLERFGQISLLGPKEPAGGRWLVLNNRGVCCALLNWHSVRDFSRPPCESRGQLLNLVATERNAEGINHLLQSLVLLPFRPFRLVAFFPEQRRVFEWRWNSRVLRRRRFGWQRRLWASSGWNEPLAVRARGQLFRAGLAKASSVDRNLLRQFHASHQPEKGPLAVCMHRRDAKTVSFSQIEVDPATASLEYQDDSPCRGNPVVRRTLRLRPSLA